MVRGMLNKTVSAILALIIMTATVFAATANASNGGSSSRDSGECGAQNSSVYWSINPEKCELTISGSGIDNAWEVDLSANAFVSGGRTYVPLRFVAESLGADVAWDGRTNIITIQK